MAKIENHRYSVTGMITSDSLGAIVFYGNFAGSVEEAQDQRGVALQAGGVISDEQPSKGLMSAAAELNHVPGSRPPLTTRSRALAR